MIFVSDVTATGGRLALILSLLAAASGCGSSADPLEIHLDALAISGTKTTLNPAFDPGVFRYSVIANDAPGDVEITPAAPAWAIISINGAITASNSTRSIGTPSPGDVVRIELVGRGKIEGQSAVYEIVYLPADFPELRVTTLEDGASDDPLYVNMNGPNSSYVAILDNHGVPTFIRREDRLVFDFKWHAGTGERSYSRYTGTQNQWGRADTEEVVLDANFNEIDVLTTVGLSHTDPHDLVLQPNGEAILISYDGALRDLTAFGLTAQEVVESSVVQVIDRATRQVMFEWNSWDSIPFDDQTYPGGLRAEYAHANSVVVDTDGNLIVSLRGLSQAVKIARPSGQVLWKLSGKSNQFQFMNDPFSQLCGQHTVSRLANGNLLAFDNGQNCWPVLQQRGNLTRVVEYRLDEVALEAELVWSYSQNGAYTTSQGSAQRLPNGNTLIGWGRGPDILATEVTDQGDKVFEIVAFDPDGLVVGYRARRYPE